MTSHDVMVRNKLYLDDRNNDYIVLCKLGSYTISSCRVTGVGPPEPPPPPPVMGSKKKPGLNRVNARGLNKSIKKRKLFRWLHIRKFDVIFLQETYSDASLEDFWRAEWGGDIFFAHGSKHSRGVMILFRPSLSKEVLNVTANKNGRFIIINTTVNEDELCLINIYAPNDQNQQITFYQKLTDSIRSCQTDKILIGGDFNCPLSAADKFGGKDIKSKKSVIQSIN